ncbi:hypothetical protein A9Q78_07420 [Methylophaga sp. 41_12_T18]|nr:hypothetical protein A9Q78_07420 [Methylophaga sp. 41_12_T18]
MDKDLIGEAIKSLELIDIHLYSTSISRFEEINSDNYPEGMAQQNKISIKAEFLEKEEDSDGSALIHAKIEFGLRFVEENEESEINTLAEIEACFIVKYHQSQEISEEAINEFMEFNVVHNAWPFWREHAFRSAAQAKLPTPMISLFKPASE